MVMLLLVQPWLVLEESRGCLCAWVAGGASPSW